MTTQPFPPPPDNPGPAAPFPPPPVAGKPKLTQRRWFPWALGAGCLVVGVGIGSSGQSSSSAADASGTPVAATTVFATPTVGASTDTVTATQTATETVTARPAAPAKPRATTVMDGDGTYLVGSDVKPGTYRARPDSGETCYWARLRSLDGGMNAVIANNLSEGPQVVAIRSTDKAIEVRGCGTWTKIG